MMVLVALLRNAVDIVSYRRGERLSEDRSEGLACPKLGGGYLRS